MDQTGNPRGLGLGREQENREVPDRGLGLGRDRNSGRPGGSVRPNPPRPWPPISGGSGPIQIPIPRPIPQPVREILQVNNALVEEVEISPQFSTVTIQYRARNHFNQLVIQRVRLIITNDTVIQNQLGARIGIWGIRRGMRVNVRFSSRFTRSIPPQAQAYSIRIIGF